jgi:chromosome segregation ATPase
MKAAIIILIICSLGLGFALLYRHNKAVQQQQADQAVKIELTNKLEDVRKKFEDQERVSMFLQTNLDMRSQELLSTSNTLIKTSADLARTQKEAQAAAEAAKAEMAKRDARINELESQKIVLDKQATDLESAISRLKLAINDTETKLAASEGDREFLLKELKRLQIEKADLERQFNDLSILRTQVAKLKDELSIARRLEWIRMGIYGQQAIKGAERLMTPGAVPAAASNFNLNVELKQDGGATIKPNDGGGKPAVQK